MRRVALRLHLQVLPSLSTLRLLLLPPRKVLRMGSYGTIPCTAIHVQYIAHGGRLCMQNGYTGVQGVFGSDHIGSLGTRDGTHLKETPRHNTRNVDKGSCKPVRRKGAASDST